ncbi:A24 family peptidase [Alkalibacillus haloalkaliphilus]|uniref:Type 4 prepilin peptidase 1 n=1 Tax=Alkalibacillus haloalkaliphilus TaxID=94136 RepID=A0A511W2U0_9BACI|nr:A24 family peptidase [Alkalibacillus haloalkaliphilus]GEN45081.1 type 4 prepilin peptidase 1 [Alkalibacillus haloalkaliphilus]
MLIHSFLILVLTITLITDILSRKILNIITFPAMLLGIGYHTYINGLEGLTFSLIGLLVGFTILLIPFLLGGIGAGDVKLMAAIGALMGAQFVFYAFLLTALIGGIISIFLMLKNRTLFPFFKRIYFKLIYKQQLATEPRKKHISIPYGVPIVLGTFIVMFWGGI